MTKEKFLTNYRDEIMSRYEWAYDVDKLDRFMASVRRTITTQAKTWNHDGDAVMAAWRSVGGKGKPTLKGLRALA